MRAVLLAAGLGTRLRPLTELVPKCLMPVNGRPLLAYWLHALAAAGIDPVLVNLHHHADLVQRWLAEAALPNAVQTVFEPELLGTGGTLLANREFCGAGPVLVVHADNLCGADLADFARAHAARPAGTEITMMTFVTDDPASCGIVELDARGVVVGFHEKVAQPPGNLANGAVYIIEPTVLDFLAARGKRVIDFSTEVLPHYLGRIATFHNDVFHCDIGTPQALLGVQYRYEGLAPGRHRGGSAASRPWPAGFVAALAAALGAGLIDIDGEGALAAAASRAAGAGLLVLRIGNGLRPEETAAAIARYFAGRLDTVYVCFPAVPAGFSSAALFRRYGVRTVGVDVLDQQPAAGFAPAAVTSTMASR